VEDTEIPYAFYNLECNFFSKTHNVKNGTLIVLDKDIFNNYYQCNYKKKLDLDLFL